MITAKAGDSELVSGQPHRVDDSRGPGGGFFRDGEGAPRIADACRYGMPQRCSSDSQSGTAL